MDEALTDRPAQAPNLPLAPMAKSAGRGAAALSGASLAMRALNFLGQVVLGAVLIDRDFGLFAIANSVAGFIMVLRDGGMQTLIVQRGESEYEELEGPAFWLGLAFNSLAGILLAVAAPWIAVIYHEPRLTSMLWVIAASIPLNSLAFVSLARLRMDMRFGALSAIDVMSGVVRYGGMIVCALAGLGPLAFVVPLVAVAILESAAAYAFTRRTPWTRPLHVERWGALMAPSVWLIVSSLAGNALYMGSYMALGLTASTALVGLYFFGYSFMQQSGHLIISTAERVLLPVFSRLRAEPERQRSAALRTLRAVSVLSFSVCVGLGVLFGPIEHLIWKNKWAPATGVVHIMTIAYPLFILHVIARCVVMGWGRFRAHALSVAMAGAILMLLSTGVGAITSQVTLVAWISAVGMALVSFAYLVWGLRELKLGPGLLLAEIVPVVVCSVAALGAGIQVDRLTLGALGSAGYGLDVESLRGRLLADGARLVAAGLASALVLVVALRLFVSQGFRECVDVLPDRIGGPTRRWFRL